MGGLRDTSSVFRRVGDSDQVDPWLLQRAIDVRSADQSGSITAMGILFMAGFRPLAGDAAQYQRPC
jgi:hypothetical protein